MLFLHSYLSTNNFIHEYFLHIQLDGRMFPDTSYSPQHLSLFVITHKGKIQVETFVFNTSETFDYEACYELV